MNKLLVLAALGGAAAVVVYRKPLAAKLDQFTDYLELQMLEHLDEDPAQADPYNVTDHSDR